MSNGKIQFGEESIVIYVQITDTNSIYLLHRLLFKIEMQHV